MYTWNTHKIRNHLSVQFSSVTQSCPTLDPMNNCNTPGRSWWAAIYGVTQSQTQLKRLSSSSSSSSRPPCPSPTPGVHSNSSPSSRWCHPAISSSVGPFSSCPQSLPASELLYRSSNRYRSLSACRDWNQRSWICQLSIIVNLAQHWIGLSFSALK